MPEYSRKRPPEHLPEQQFREYLHACPLIAILRGIRPGRELLDIADGLLEQGIRLIEVPLNSPDALLSIEALRAHINSRGLCGAGTVLKTREVNAVKNAGGQFIVSPNCDTTVIEESLHEGLVSLPGCMTPTEVFAAIHAGTSFIKLFPAATLGFAYLHSLRSVLPANTILVAVGGIGADSLADYWCAGARGFGLGTNLYRPDDTAEDVTKRARKLAECAANLSPTENHAC